MVREAYETVPLYIRNSEKAGIHMGEILEKERWEEVPILERNQIEELFIESLEDERLRVVQHRFEYQEELFPDKKTGKLKWFKSNI